MIYAVFGISCDVIIMNYNEYRRKTKKLSVGRVNVGGDSPIAVQSMTNVSSSDYDALYVQMRALEDAGCDIIRMTVPDDDAVRNLYKLKCSDIKMPIVADIHFSYRLSIESANAGADKIRINPGNIGGEDRVKAVVNACSQKNIPIRIGVNGGSLEKELLNKYGSPTPQALYESAMSHIKILEKYDFNDIIVAIKSSDVRNMMGAVRLIADKCEYPIHLGVTEAGTEKYGIVKSSVGIGGLLSEGIGDTIRVSLTDDPIKEVKQGRAILRALGIDSENHVNVVSCPTCGRTKIDLIALATRLEEKLENIKVNRPLTVAVMGCAVNGPGEAREADIGVAGGIGEALLFKHGEIIKKIPEDQVIDVLLDEIRRIGQE